MSLRSSVTEELQRSPIAALSGALGAIIAAVSLMVALLQDQPTSRNSTSLGNGIGPVPDDIVLGNMFLVIAHFLAITIAVAIFLRLLARRHDIAALFASIPLVALSNFSTILAIYLAPPRALSRELFESAHDLIFYSSAAIVIAFCGAAVLRDMASTGTKGNDGGTGQESSAGGFIVFALLLLAIWSWLVFAGQTRLTRTLLPEITHPAPAKVAMAPNHRINMEKM